MLELQGITKKYGGRTALEGVSLSLDSGVYALLGPNGAGKSTLMGVITGSLRPDSGRVLWDGAETRRLGAAYRGILGFAPQGRGLYDAFTGRRFLSYMAALKGIPRRDRPEEIARVLGLTDMTSEAARPIGTYSGGMRQRILTAQALLGDPKLLVLDEPTAGLDPGERVRLRERIARFAEGRTVLISTHVVSDIETTAGDVILLKGGRTVDRGPVDELCMKYLADSLEEVYLRVFGEEGQDGQAHMV